MRWQVNKITRLLCKDIFWLCVTMKVTSFKSFHYAQSCRKTLGNFPRYSTLYIPAFSHDRERRGQGIAGESREKQGEGGEERKKPGEHERNTRQRVRKSECHCRNLRTLTSSWLVPPSSSWSQPSSSPSSVNIHPSSSSSFSLSSLFLSLSSLSLSHLHVSLRILSFISL